jgi:hypothetical protein
VLSCQKTKKTKKENNTNLHSSKRLGGQNHHQI